MKYLRYFESKHQIKDFFDNKSLINEYDLSEWEITYKDRIDFYKEEYINLSYKYNKRIYVKLNIKHKKFNSFCKIFIEVSNAILRLTRVDKFDLYDLLNEVLKFDKNFDIYDRFKKIHKDLKPDDEFRYTIGVVKPEDNDFYTKFLSIHSKNDIDNIKILKLFNDRVEELYKEYDYLLSGEDMGLL